ncbi:hypothetical protein Q0812_13395 [Brevundimonas sp. 2R-24]|uniref:Uncharacterized protein n=1 Tax=Peiella sedimenti TaxID=3061083 RepID=A0ABT8SPK5_9CAUL|nr:hypothetical protein [Caulobacteraceae bacterium XZ-24]
MAAAKSTEINLPPLNLQTLKVKLIGDSPLIVHAWSEKALRAMADKQQKKATAGRQAKDPWEDFCGSLYWLSEKPEKPTEADVERAKFGFPAIAFKAAAVTAVTSTGGMTKVAARQAFHIEGGEFVEIIGPPPSMREDVCRVGMGTADLRYRGEFSPWSVELLVKFNANVLSAEQVVSLFEAGGFAVGVGEWRPERDGPYGRFHVARDGEG